MKKGFFAIFPLFLTACSSIPPSYLPQKSSPIVNIEAELAENISVQAKPSRVILSAHKAQQLAYKLFWYNAEGVSQTTEEAPWQQLSLQEKAQLELPLTKPTAESENYRIYLKAVK